MLKGHLPRVIYHHVLVYEDKRCRSCTRTAKFSSGMEERVHVIKHVSGPAFLRFETLPFIAGKAPFMVVNAPCLCGREDAMCRGKSAVYGGGSAISGGNTARAEDRKRRRPRAHLQGRDTNCFCSPHSVFVPHP